MGDANRWFPTWLRWLPHVHIEGSEFLSEVAALPDEAWIPDLGDQGRLPEPVGSTR